jgi:hypothetical protein
LIDESFSFLIDLQWATSHSLWMNVVTHFSRRQASAPPVAHGFLSWGAITVSSCRSGGT